MKLALPALTAVSLLLAASVAEARYYGGGSGYSGRTYGGGGYGRSYGGYGYGRSYGGYGRSYGGYGRTYGGYGGYGYNRGTYGGRYIGNQFVTDFQKFGPLGSPHYLPPRYRDPWPGSPGFYYPNGGYNYGW